MKPNHKIEDNKIYFHSQFIKFVERQISFFIESNLKLPSNI